MYMSIRRNYPIKNKIKLQDVIIVTLLGGYVCFIVYNVIF